eukprot:62795-Prymnesium_polylepis.1
MDVDGELMRMVAGPDAAQNPCRGYWPAENDLGLRELCDTPGTWGTITVEFLWHVQPTLNSVKFPGVSSIATLKKSNLKAWEDLNNEAAELQTVHGGLYRATKARDGHSALHATLCTEKADEIFDCCLACQWVKRDRHVKRRIANAEDLELIAKTGVLQPGQQLRYSHELHDEL